MGKSRGKAKEVFQTGSYKAEVSHFNKATSLSLPHTFFTKLDFMWLQVK